MEEVNPLRCSRPGCEALHPNASAEYPGEEAGWRCYEHDPERQLQDDLHELVVRYGIHRRFGIASTALAQYLYGALVQLGAVRRNLIVELPGRRRHRVTDALDPEQQS